MKQIVRKLSNCATYDTSIWIYRAGAWVEYENPTPSSWRRFLRVYESLPLQH